MNSKLNENTTFLRTVTSSATDNQSSDTHLAENHEDTTSGAVHYFQVINQS